MHSAAVQASVLGEQDTAIYAYDFSVGKSGLEGILGTLVLCLVLVEGEQYGTVHYEEVGLVWRHSNELVWLALKGTEGL